MVTKLMVTPTTNASLAPAGDEAGAALAALILVNFSFCCEKIKPCHAMLLETKKRSKC
jgi:hypothetical protein